MPKPPAGIPFPGTSLNATVLSNFVKVPFKSRMIMPGEQARPSEGNLIRENRSKHGK
jgi:hypothetical protein